MGDVINSADRLRQRAAEMRAKAEQATAPETKRILLDVAEAYLKLAVSIEARARRLDRGISDTTVWAIGGKG